MRIGHAPALPHAVQQQIGQRDQAHALVVGHEGADRCEGRILGLARRRVVQRFDKAVAGAWRQNLQALEVGHGQARRQRRSQRRGIRRDDQFVRRGWPHGQARHPLRRVLVGQRVVTGRVGRFTDAPGNALPTGKRDLLLQGHQASAVQGAAPWLVQNQPGHQVFEHRTRPGAQAGRYPDGEKGPPECGPVARWHVALGNGQQAGQA